MEKKSIGPILALVIIRPMSVMYQILRMALGMMA